MLRLTSQELDVLWECVEGWLHEGQVDVAMYEHLQMKLEAMKKELEK